METLNPQFENLEDPNSFINHLNGITIPDIPLVHEKILQQLLEQMEPINFKDFVSKTAQLIREELERCDPDSERAEKLEKSLYEIKIKDKHYIIITVEQILDIAKKNRWGLCKNNNFIHLYNGAFWNVLDKEMFQKFLGEAGEKMGVEKFSARHYMFREHLFKQFLTSAYLPTPILNQDTVLINLLNGTYEIISNGAKKLRKFQSSDFLTYQLPFEYDLGATASIFQNYLDRVLPDKSRQLVLAEYLGYIFIKNGGKTLKEEKALILYGSGANGKSVFFEVVNALLGTNNVGNYSLQNLTNENGYYRACLANKLVNYASEMNGRLEASIFKQMVSGEPIEARLPYGEPFILTQYAKLIFNCNELPKEVEHSHAYFRRFLIIPFEETIPEEEQDKTLHLKIIENELSGVFNWVLDGLDRLLQNKKFSDCKAAQQAVESYKSQSDSVKQFLDEYEYISNLDGQIKIKELYTNYRFFCDSDGFRALSKPNFIKRLKACNVVVDKINIGNIARLKQINEK